MARRVRLARRSLIKSFDAAVEERWRPTSQEQFDRRGRGEPLTHRLVRLPGTSHRSRGLLGPLESLVVDG